MILLLLKKKTLGPTYTIPIATGVFILSGIAAGTLFNRVLIAAKGTFTLSGVAVAFQLTHRLIAVTGVFVVSGKNVILTYSGATAKKIYTYMMLRRRRK